MNVITKTDSNCKNSDLVEDQNGFARSSAPTVTGKLNDVRQLLQDNAENNQGDGHQKREKINCKKVIPCLHREERWPY